MGLFKKKDGGEDKNEKNFQIPSKIDLGVDSVGDLTLEEFGHLVERIEKIGEEINEYGRNLITPDELEIDTSQTPEKFKHFAKEVVAFLTDGLQMLNELERDIFERAEILVKKRVDDRVSAEEMDLYQENGRRSREIFNQISLDTKGERTSFGMPLKYDYINYSDTKITFIMKSANRATVETDFLFVSFRKQEQFLLKRENNQWKIEMKKNRYSPEDKWSKHVL